MRPPASPDNERMEVINDSMAMVAPVEALEVDFEFYPRAIPDPPCVILMATFCIGFYSFVCSYLGVVVIARFDFGRVLWLQYSLCIILVAYLTTGTCNAILTHRQREALFVRGRDGTLELSKENWKGGTYLVGSEALIDYDGSRAWCFPKDYISSVEVEKEDRRYLYDSYLIIISRKTG